ncbi:hypothetical protein HY636_02285 [Candidatus Woesearchaeota archaeon]|nr:hypothetical protein [Candidatus Woesearchaeota archaeon]
MTLYTLVTGNGNATNVINLFDRTSVGKTDDFAKVNEISSINVNVNLIIRTTKQVNLAFETEKEAQHYADILNKRIKGRRSRFNEFLYGTIEGSIDGSIIESPISFSPRLVSDETERRFREGIQSGKFDFNYKLIKKSINSGKWLIRSVVMLAGIAGVYIPQVFFQEFFAEKYHNALSWYLENRGSAYIRIYGPDGLDSIGLTNNTADNPNLTPIPQFPQISLRLTPTYSSIGFSACQGHPAEIRFTYSDIKSGHYVFNAKLIDCKGSIEDKIYEFDIDNPQGGMDKIR